MALLLSLAVALLAGGCGSDPDRTEDTTGHPASPLGRVFDVDADLPHVTFEAGAHTGVRLELELKVDAGGHGTHDAAVRFGPATIDGERHEVEDLSGGRTTLTTTGDAFVTGRIGPLRVNGTAFEMQLDGRSADGGWSATGDAWESQTGLGGSFRGWRRHRFLVAATDFAFGGSIVLVEVARGGAPRAREVLRMQSSDARLRVTGGGVFVVNRLTFDNVVRLDPDDDFAAAWQASVGAGANPQDVLLEDDRLYVTRYEPPFDDVALLLPQGGAHRGEVPLGPVAENPDGTPRPDRLVAAEGAVFVGLQDIDRTFEHYAEGKLAVIDPQTEELAGIVPLGGENPGPIETWHAADGRTRLYVALAGVFPGLLPQRLSGGVVVVDARNRALERWALDDDAVGGNVGGFALASEELGYVVVSDDAWRNRVVAFSPAAAEPLRTVWETDLLVPELDVSAGGLLAVPDRDPLRPRLCLYRVPEDPSGMETLLGCPQLPLPPFSVVALD